MKFLLNLIAEWANKKSDVTESEQRKAYNYLGHYALIAATQKG